MPNILLGITGSVAATLTVKLALALQQIGDVKIVFTKWGDWFITPEDRSQLQEANIPYYRDEDEWSQNWKKDDPVLHIELRKWASCLVIAPLSANTLAKMANGLCDNLLTSVFRAWDHCRPVIVAPAMNTLMWQNHPTTAHINTLRRDFSIKVIPPISKTLACGDVGEGAMAQISDIVRATQDSLRWHFPLAFCTGIPLNHHPGAFGFHRRNNFHTGVDLYTKHHELVHAVEDGIVVKIEKFTGPSVGHPWWEETWGMLVEGASGVVNYGEINAPPHWVEVGKKVEKRQYIGNVQRVLFPDKLRPDIPGHSCSMLHMELYKHGVREFAHWHDPAKNPDLLDPTPYLMGAIGAPSKTLTWDNTEGKTVG
jgi:hypothetical protein